MANIAQLAVGVRNDAGPGSRAFTRDVDRMRVGANRATASIGTMQGSMAAAGRTAKGAGASILAAFGVFGGIAVIAGATKAIKEFEETMALAGKVSRASGEQFERMAEQAKMLGATTRFTAAEAADGLLFLSRAGFQAEEAMAALPATLNLAAAGVMGLGEAADLASNVVKQFQLAAEDTVRVVDALIIVSNRANTNVTQLGEAMKYAGPVAAAVGMSVEQTAAAMGALGDAGIQASLAGTNLRGVLAGLLGPTSKAEDALKRMGLELEDVDVTKRGLVDVFETFAKANISAADAVAIFGRRNAAAALVLADSTVKMRELEVATKLNRGEAEEMSEVMNNTLAGALRALKSAFEATMLSTGESGFTGALRGVVDTATGVLRVFAGMGHTVEGNRTVIMGLVTVLEILVVRFVALKALSLLTFFGNLTRSIYAAAVAARAAGGGFAMLGAAATAAGGPLTIIATALATGVALFHNYSRATEEQTARMEELRRATDAYSDALSRVGRQVGFEGRVSAQVTAVESLVRTLESARAASEGAFGTVAEQGERYRRFVEMERNRGLRGGRFEEPTPFRIQISDEFRTQIDATRKAFAEMQTDILARLNEIKTADISPARQQTELLGLYADVEKIVRSAADAVALDPTGSLKSAFEEFRGSLEAADVVKTLEQINDLSKQISADAAIPRPEEGFRDQIAQAVEMEAITEKRIKLGESLDDQIRQINESMTVQNLIAQDMNREAAQMEALFQAQNSARAQGLTLEQQQIEQIMDIAGQQYDQLLAMEQARERQLEQLREQQELEREAERVAKEAARSRETAADQLVQKVAALASEVAALSVEYQSGREAADAFLETQRLQELAAQATAGATEAQTDKVRALLEQQKALSQERDTLNRQMQEQRKVEELERQIAQGFSNMVSSIVTGSATAEEALQNFAKAIMDMVVQQIVAATVTRVFMSAIGGPLAGAVGGAAVAASANGNVFRGGSIVPFAYGGVVDGPAFFPMTGGQTGLMGEAGPEAIMPLRRGKHGRLGVEVTGEAASAPQKNVTINMNVRTADADSFRRSRSQISRQLRAAQSEI